MLDIRLVLRLIVIMSSSKMLCMSMPHVGAYVCTYMEVRYSYIELSGAGLYAVLFLLFLF
ncbi:hypothetical protein F4779DRAFT_596184, partial [Xylariaceae sp. FL0662B]